MAICTGFTPVANAQENRTKSSEALMGTPFVPNSELDLGELEQIVLARSPTSERAQLEVDLAQAASEQAHLLPNPVLDGTWGTIPLGTSNPPDLQDPLGNIPHYDVGLSYTFLLGKRGPLQDRAHALVVAAEAGRADTARLQALDLASSLGRIAALQLRLAGLRDLVDQGAEAIQLAEARVAAKFGIPLEVDRLRIDVERTQQQISSTQAELNGALGECTLLVTTPCSPFSNSEEARSFLTRWTRRALTATGELTQRADLQALTALTSAAEADLNYAKALAVPDPTLRLGYTHDRFLVSGNQMNSLTISVSLPLPLFDRGQAQKRAATAERERLAGENIRRRHASTSALGALRARVATHLQQQRALADDLIPRAHDVLRSLQRAAESGLVPLTDTLQARRTLGELLIDESESYQAGFDAALALAAELPSSAFSHP